MPDMIFGMRMGSVLKDNFVHIVHITPLVCVCMCVCVCVCVCVFSYRGHTLTTSLSTGDAHTTYNQAGFAALAPFSGTILRG